MFLNYQSLSVEVLHRSTNVCHHSLCKLTCGHFAKSIMGCSEQHREWFCSVNMPNVKYGCKQFMVHFAAI